MHELSQRKVHGFWTNLKHMLYPWPKVDALDTSAHRKMESNKLAGYEPRSTMGEIMLILAIVGVVAAAYFAYRSGAF